MGVMRHKDFPVELLVNLRCNLLKRRCLAYHLVRYPGKSGDKHRHSSPGIDQRLKPSRDLNSVMVNYGNLRHAVIFRITTGSLYIYDGVHASKLDSHNKLKSDGDAN